ncbi:hypothetical protein RO3G_06070 [Rhizopus delemar RA 99-880]|uniref:Uncharacterized protein n=1 Tax=Rhizopus delemar (strain RA 99-880 / ATCC MYA-4621 / FGSC 9543 / NRRL 43880) TaxID=246409 RepID=I1BYT5_RHIO9|nr:hypothetical protein RO3G_06070 [Rhizopus delemar RA 99-880]|eukprot:EIE81365.1 hypothetical protein RO3G_06070 [Rhizopus delemar RA 99-880]
MFNGVQIRALSRSVLKTPDLVGLFPPSSITTCMTGSTILLEDKIPLLMHCDICKPRMEPIGQNIDICFLVYGTGINNF